MIDWKDIAGELITQFLRIMIPVVIVLCLKWFSEIWSKLKEKNPKLAELIAIAGEIGYCAAEEYFRGENISGYEKMNFALARADEYLKTLGINIKLDVIRDAIIDYGITNYKFTWVKRKNMEDIIRLDEIESKEEKESSEEDDEGGQ